MTLSAWWGAPTFPLPPRVWWHDPSLARFDQHPISHALGGAAVYAFLRLVHEPHAVAWTAFFQFLWEKGQREFYPAYPTYSVVWDALTATVVAALVSLVW